MQQLEKACAAACREGEEFLEVLDADSGNCGFCGRPYVEGLFRWKDSADDPDDPFRTGRSFRRLVHADGSEECVHVGTRFRCPDCRSEDITYEDTGYGTTARCACGWHKYIDRGD